MEDFENWFKSDKNVQEKQLKLTERPNFEDIRQTFKNLCPVLFYETKNAKSNEDFWELSAICVSRVTNYDSEKVDDFEKFMKTVFQNETKFNPKNVQDYVYYVTNYSCPPLSNFMFVNFATLVKDPEMLIRVLSFLKTRKRSIFNHFQQEKGAVEKVFDMFLSYLSFPLMPHSKEFWEVRLMLCDILVDCICKNAQFVVLADAQMSYLHQKLLKLIGDADPYAAIPFIRLIIVFHKATMSRVKPEIYSKRLTNLLNAVPVGMPGHPMIAYFVAKEMEKIDMKRKLAPVIFSQGFSGTWDVEFIASLGSFKDQECTLMCVQMLAKVMCLSYKFSRIAAYCLSRLLSGFKFTEAITDWFLNFLEQLQVACALQKMQKKYKVRRARLNELLLSDFFRRIDFVNEYLEHFDPESEEFQNRLKDADTSSTYLKYAPFNQKGLSLVGTVHVKKSGKKKKGKKSKRADSVPPNLNVQVPSKTPESESVLSMQIKAAKKKGRGKKSTKN